MRNKKGFTLMELMVTMAIIALMAAIAIPNFIGWFPRYRLGAGSRDFHDFVQFARIRAVKQNLSTAVVLDAGNGTYDLVELNPVNLEDGDANGIPDGIENGNAPSILEGRLPGDVQITGNTFWANLILFNPRGFPRSPGTITIDSTSASVAEQRLLNVTPSGGIDLIRN